MVSSIDGRIDCDMVDKISGDEYYTALAQLDCPSQLTGRTTAAMHYALPKRYKGEEYGIGKEASYRATACEGYFVVVDTKGSLLYDHNRIDGLPLLVLTSEQAQPAYLAWLEQHAISYLCVGKEHVDLARAMQVLHKEFGVKRLAVCGGGNINGAFLSLGLLDEVSLLVAAGVDGRRGQVAVFDGISDGHSCPTPLHLESVQRIDGTDTIWIRYKTR